MSKYVYIINYLMKRSPYKTLYSCIFAAKMPDNFQHPLSPSHQGPGIS